VWDLKIFAHLLPLSPSPFHLITSSLNHFLMSSFTIRVYGICIENDCVLVCDEFIYGMKVTKFPGGGLHFGEGTIECLEREMLEETFQEAEVLHHFYTTDFFVPSAFDPSRQVISIYYHIKFKGPVKFSVSEKVFDFPELKNKAQSFRWIRLSELSADNFTLPIDQKVAEMLVTKFVKTD
jgi:8-oxo-dGTP diphosphatase